MTTYTPTRVSDWANGNRIRQALCVLVGTGLLALSARVEIPFWPVPFSMQTFVVLALGMVYGPVLGAATVLTYLAQGLMGLPVFVGGGGPAYLAGPTGGYLLGMVAAAWVAGWLAFHGWARHPLTAIAAAGIGNLPVYLLGLPWLAVWVGSAEQAVVAGLVPIVNMHRSSRWTRRASWRWRTAPWWRRAQGSSRSSTRRGMPGIT